MTTVKLKCNKLQLVLAELMLLADHSDFPRNPDNIFVEFNTSNSHGYGYTTKLIKVNPYTVNIGELIEAGLGSNNCFSHHIYDVEISEDGESVKPITVLSEIYKFANANKETMKEPHLVYLSKKSPDYEQKTKFEAQLVYDGIMYNLQVEDIDTLSTMPAKNYDVQIVPADTPMRSYYQDAYEDDPGCGLYYYGWEDL